MSIYKILDTPAPTISYCILHQGAAARSGEEYLDTLRDLHASLRRESESIATAHAKYIRDVVSRESQVLRGTLSEFLSTPVRSDTASVQRIFTDSFERFRNQVAGDHVFGVSRSYEGKIISPPFQKTVERNLAAAGKAYLKSLGFSAGKEKGEVFESVFVVEGGMNLDLIEHIIRDRLGIYAATHGTHLDLTGKYMFAAYNLIGNWGMIGRDHALSGQTELVFFFSKPAMQYAPFRAGLLEVFGALSKELALPSLTLWQRKLGLGKGKEFIARCLCPSPKQAGETIRRIEQAKEPAFVKKALLDEGSLVLKELLLP